MQKFGISVPPSVEEQWQRNPAAREMKFFPNFALREMFAWYIALGVLGALAALAPWGLGAKADPFAAAPAGIKPEWYFLFMFQTLKLIPAKIWFIDGDLLGVLGFGLAGAVWVVLPFLDRKKHFNTRRGISGFAFVFLGYVVGMTVYGFIAK